MSERSLQHGQCIKCAATIIRARTMSFGPISNLMHVGSAYQPLHLVRLFVCVTCGYSEVYARAQELAGIARSREWDNVPYQPAVGEYTGVTTRLTPPDEQ